MTRPTRELLECEVVIGRIRGGRGGGSFKAQVSRLIRLGYEPLGHPKYGEDEAILTMIRGTGLQRKEKR